jgi:DNA polymerase III subunit beta
VAEGKLTLAAADTFRLAERVVELPEMTEAQQVDILIPARNLVELSRVLPAAGPVQVMVTPRGERVVFHAEQGEQGERIDFVSRLIEGAFPPYKQVFKKLAEIPTPTRVVVDTRALVQAAKRAALVAVDAKKTMRLTCHQPGDGALFGTIIADADDADLGDIINTLQAEVTGEDQLIYFNVKYLGEALEHIDTPQVALLLYASGRPVLLKPVSDVPYTSLVQTQVIQQASA